MNKAERIKELEHLIELKTNEWASTDAIQYSLKIMLNSFYGVFSNIYFRYFDLRLAAAVTSNGQVSIRGPLKYLEEKIPILNVEYADTDSLFISLKKILDKRFPDGATTDERRQFAKKVSADRIVPILDEYYERMTNALNTYKNTYEMDFETIADNTIFVGKKRYVMNQVFKDGYDLPLDGKPDLKVRGIEVVRTSTPMFIRDELRNLVERILISNSNDECLKIIETIRAEFKKSPFEKVAFPRTANIKDYTLESKSLPIHIRGALTYNRAIKDMDLNVEIIRNGDKVRFCYIKVPNHLGGNIIACPGDKMPEQLLERFEIDYDTQFEKSFLAPVKLIFDALQWNTEQIASLENFFD